MALTRKALTAMGLSAEQVDSIIEMHTETVEGLKAYKTDAEKLPGVQAQLDEANKKLEAAGKDDYKEKYEALVKENQQKEVRTAKESVIRDLCKDVGLSEKGTALALKYTNLDTIELGSDGKPTNGAAVKEALLSDWGDYKETRNQTGADVKNPPNGGGGGNVLTMDEIYKMENGRYKLTAAQRQSELAKLRESQTQKG